MTNSCHIISVLVYLFGNLRLEKKTKNKNFIICTFRSYRQDLITVYFNIKNSDNFSIEIFDKSKRYFLSPIEKLKIFKNLEKRKIFNNKVYIPKVFKEYDEIKISGRFKPGFNTQFKTFKSFNKSKKIFNDIFLAKKVMNICKEICK